MLLRISAKALSPRCATCKGISLSTLVLPLAVQSLIPCSVCLIQSLKRSAVLASIRSCPEPVSASHSYTSGQGYFGYSYFLSNKTPPFPGGLPT